MNRPHIERSVSLGIFAASSTDDGIGYAIASTEVLPWVEVALGQTVAVSTLTCTA